MTAARGLVGTGRVGAGAHYCWSKFGRKRTFASPRLRFRVVAAAAAWIVRLPVDSQAVAVAAAIYCLRL